MSKTNVCRRAVPALLLLTALAPWASAQDARYVLAFGAEAGAPLPYPYRYAKPPTDHPTLAMRVPMVDTTIRTIFPDVELTVDSASLMVKRVHAERAYSDAEACLKVLKVVREKLAGMMSTPASDASGQWQYQSANGTVRGGAQCHAERYLPYPVLIFDMTAGS